MREYFSELCKILVAESDRELFHQVTGVNIDETIFYALNENETFLRSFFSNKKFVSNNVMTGKGSHILRIILAHRARLHRLTHLGFDQDERVVEFNKNGFLVIEDFLPESVFEKLERMITEEVSQISLEESSSLTAQDNTCVRFSNNFINKGIQTLFPINDFIQRLGACSSLLNSAITSLNIRVVHIVEPGSDSQHIFHTDTFYPLIKSFFYIHDTTEKHGPFCYVPGSNNIESSNVLRWHYENSLKNENRSMNFDTSLSEIENMGFLEKSLTAKKNTLIIGNTFGFHRRSPGDPSLKRITLNNEFLRTFPWPEIRGYP